MGAAAVPCDARRVHRITTDPGTIRRWIETRGGHPAVVTGTAGAEEGIPRVDLPGYAEQEFLQPVSWERFFADLRAKGLAFEYDDDGRYHRFVPAPAAPGTTA
jgi:hypothetical protein